MAQPPSAVGFRPSRAQTVASSSTHLGGCIESTSHVYISEAGQLLSPGDLNCDDAVDESDVPAFVELLITPNAYSGCEPLLGDLNFDGILDGDDIQPFMERVVDL